MIFKEKYCFLFIIRGLNLVPFIKHMHLTYGNPISQPPPKKKKKKKLNKQTDKRKQINIVFDLEFDSICRI